MARTKASVGAKVSSGKSSKARAVCAPSSSASASAGSSKAGWSSGGGNSVCPRETPVWQKSITNFFNTKHVQRGSDDESGSSTDKSKRRKKNVIDSDDETEAGTEKEVTNVDVHELDVSSEQLPPLDGENSHKIAEYFPKVPENSTNGKKGIGKKSKKSIDDKENESNNRRSSVKRDSDEIVDEDSGSNKRTKVSVS